MDFTVINNGRGDKEIDFGGGRNTQGFYQLARRLETILAINYYKKADNFNTLTWNYTYHGVAFILQYHWDTGTFIQLKSKTPTEEELSTLEDTVNALQQFK